MTPAGFDRGWLSRERALAIALLVMTGIAFYLCYLLALPFAAPLAWGLALAVIAHPLHHYLAKRIPWRSISAAISVAIVAVLLLLPAALVVHQIVTQAAALAQGEKKPAGGGDESIQENSARSDENAEDSPGERSRNVRNEPRTERGDDDEQDRKASQRNQQDGEQWSGFFARLENNPRFERLHEWIKPQTLQTEVNRALQRAAALAPKYVASGVWIGAQFLITLLMLFYFFRDRKQVTETVRSLLPLSEAETDDAFQRIQDTIHATIFGSLTVASIQGAMGGLMFWVLGLPGPFIWGAVMALLATIPMLGTFVIWLPAAIFLAVSGEWGKAAILVAWGAIAIGLIDNILYPVLVGKRLRFHPLLVFIFIVGGLTLFGAAGIILGPLVLSVTDALMNVWRNRTEDGGKVEEGVREN